MGTRLVALHEPRIAYDVGDDDRREPAGNRVGSHRWNRIGRRLLLGDTRFVQPRQNPFLRKALVYGIVREPCHHCVITADRKLGPEPKQLSFAGRSFLHLARSARKPPSGGDIPSTIPATRAAFSQNALRGSRAVGAIDVRRCKPHAKSRHRLLRSMARAWSRKAVALSGSPSRTVKNAASARNSLEVGSSCRAVALACFAASCLPSQVNAPSRIFHAYASRGSSWTARAESPVELSRKRLVVSSRVVPELLFKRPRAADERGCQARIHAQCCLIQFFSPRGSFPDRQSR